MPESTGDPLAMPSIPEPGIEQPRRFRVSLVWVVPIVAAVIGIWLAYTALSEQGPTVTIRFATAEGLVAGKTKIRYRDVEIGEVTAIEVSADLSHVIVTADLVHGTERYLTDNTRFWVVRAHLAVGEVRGLGTLLSGAYIGIEPGVGGKKMRSFTGLEIPPVLTRGLPGRHLLLRADSLGSLDIGSPVYYRKLKVGRVVAYELEPSGDAVKLEVFIDAPYHEYVYENTRFWNASGFDISLSAEGIRVDTESVTSLLAGGVAFEAPLGEPLGDTVAEHHVFRLFSTREAALATVFLRYIPFVLHFNQSLRGLSVGAPVNFRGIKVGRVTDIRALFDTDKGKFRLPVYIEIGQGRIEIVGHDTDITLKDKQRFFDRMIADGLRAQLKTGNILTGQLFVALDFHENVPPAGPIAWQEKIPELPTVPAPLEQITSDLVSIVDRLDKVPYQEIGHDLRKVLAALNQTLVQINDKVGPPLTKTLDQSRETLVIAEKVLRQDAPVQQDLRAALQEIAEAARALRLLVDYLERHPEALLRGKEK